MQISPWFASLSSGNMGGPPNFDVTPSHWSQPYSSKGSTQQQPTGEKNPNWWRARFENMKFATTSLPDFRPTWQMIALWYTIVYTSGAMVVLYLYITAALYCCFLKDHLSRPTWRCWSDLARFTWNLEVNLQDNIQKSIFRGYCITFYLSIDVVFGICYFVRSGNHKNMGLMPT